MLAHSPTFVPARSHNISHTHSAMAMQLRTQHAPRKSTIHFGLCPDYLNSTVIKCEPAPRNGHQTIVIGGNLYMWAGLMTPEVHDSPEKRAFVSSVDVFDLESGDWVQQLTSGTPPLGVAGYACAAVGDELHYFGGYCGHGDCYHNGVHKLSTSSLQWVMLSPTTSEDGPPMKKAHCGMVAFKDGEENILFVVAGVGTTPSSHQPGAQYDKSTDVRVRCNEQHMFLLSTSE